MQWYLSKIKYRRLIKMKPKTVTELYLINCFSYSDADFTIQEILRSRVADPDVDAIAKDRVKDVYKYSDTLLTDVEGTFYRVFIAFTMGKGKIERETHIVNAMTPEIAIKRVHDRLKLSMLSYKIKDVKETDILGIWDKNNVVWTQDFTARMEDLVADGLVQVNQNQTKIKFGDEEFKTTAEIQKDLKDALSELDVTVEVKDKETGEYHEIGKSKKTIVDMGDVARKTAEQFGASSVTISGEDSQGNVVGEATYTAPDSPADEPPKKEDIAKKFARAMGHSQPAETV